MHFRRLTIELDQQNGGSILGYSSYPKKSSTALIVTLSMISMPAGNNPAAVMERTASPAAAIVAKSASSTLTHSGALKSRSVMAVAIPRVPSPQ